MLVLMTATACGSNRPTEPSQNAALSDADLQACVSETNRLRASVGLSSLSRDSDIERIAAAAAEADHNSGNAHGYFLSHGGAAAENEALRWSTSDSGRAVMLSALSLFWSEGPNGPHRQNIAGPYSRVGCGAYRAGTLITIVQDFR